MIVGIQYFQIIFLAYQVQFVNVRHPSDGMADDEDEHDHQADLGLKEQYLNFDFF